MSFKEETLKKIYVYKGKILNLRADDVLAANDNVTKREIVEHNGGACVLCERDDKILLVRQYRYAVDRFTWELPAGKTEPGEPPKITALRELEEEGGVRAADAELMFTMHPTPGYSSEAIYIFKAINLSEGKINFDDDEDINSEWFDKDTLRKMIKEGEITDGKTLVALLSVL